MVKFYRSPVRKEILKSLSKTSNINGSFHALIHYGLIISCWFLIFYCLETSREVLAIPLLMILGPTISFLGWSGMGHELLHRTFFKNLRMNRWLLIINSVLTWNNWAYHEISHKVHHRNTLIEDIDFEFDPQQEPLAGNKLISALFFDFTMFFRAIRNTVMNASGQIPGQFAIRHFPHGSDSSKKVVHAARIILITHSLCFMYSLISTSIFPFLCVSLAPFIFSFPTRVLALAQHIGLKQNEIDFRLNSRTLKLPKILSFLYCNMNYHIEHHMYPSVTSHNLPQLHEEIKGDLPEPLTFKEAIQMCVSFPSFNLFSSKLKRS
jgi:fatty acid desaturase